MCACRVTAPACLSVQYFTPQTFAFENDHTELYNFLHNLEEVRPALHRGLPARRR